MAMNVPISDTVKSRFAYTSYKRDGFSKNLRTGDKFDNRDAYGSIPSEMGGKIVASAVFLDLGIVDSITDKHRNYPASFVIPIIK